jgi:hypothetical protein
MRRALLVVAVLLLAAAPAAGSSLHRVAPAMADPALVPFGDGRLQVFGTGDAINTVTVGADGSACCRRSALQPPSWADAGPQVWAPDVFPWLGKGTLGWTMYFSASHGGQRCLGTATAAAPDGTFVATPQMYCPPAGYEAIDPALVIANGKRYVTFKTSVTNSSDFTIWALRMNGEDGARFSHKAPAVLVHRDKALMENPDLAFHDGTFWLFLARKRWDTCDYYTDAWSATRFPARFHFRKRVTGTNGLCGAGGLSVYQDAATDRVVLHAWNKDPASKGKQHRDAWLGALAWDAAGVPYIG